MCPSPCPLMRQPIIESGEANDMGYRRIRTCGRLAANIVPRLSEITGHRPPLTWSQSLYRLECRVLCPVRILTNREQVVVHMVAMVAVPCGLWHRRARVAQILSSVVGRGIAVPGFGLLSKAVYGMDPR